MSYSRS